MNEQELMIKKKIEKREKVDTILAYILLVIITICIIIVVYIKFFREDEVVENNEYTANYITLNEISSALANSNLASQEGGATLNSTSTTDMLTVDYSKESRSVRLDIPLNINEFYRGAISPYNPRRFRLPSMGAVSIYRKPGDRL